MTRHLRKHPADQRTIPVVLGVALLTQHAATKKTDDNTAAALLAIGRGAGGDRGIDPHLLQLVMANKSPSEIVRALNDSAGA